MAETQTIQIDDRAQKIMGTQLPALAVNLLHQLEQGGVPNSFFYRAPIEAILLYASDRLARPHDGVICYGRSQAGQLTVTGFPYCDANFIEEIADPVSEVSYLRLESSTATNTLNACLRYGWMTVDAGDRLYVTDRGRAMMRDNPEAAFDLRRHIPLMRKVEDIQVWNERLLMQVVRSTINDNALNPYYSYNDLEYQVPPLIRTPDRIIDFDHRPRKGGKPSPRKISVGAQPTNTPRPSLLMRLCNLWR